MNYKRCMGVGILLLVLLAACAKKTPPSVPAPEMRTETASPGKPIIRTQRPYQIYGIWYYPLPSADGYVEEGVASWYGPGFHGKPTACGETYDMEAMTAAHKTLPLGTYVKVTHLENSQSIIVRVNDRGPFVAGRIIDLSSKASQMLGVRQKGVAHVRVEAIELATQERMGKDTFWKVQPAPSFRYGLFAIQIGSFKEQANAYRLQQNLSSNFKTVQILPFNHDGNQFYRVQVGAYRDLMLARQEMQKLQQNGFGDAFVIAMEGQ